MPAATRDDVLRRLRRMRPVRSSVGTVIKWQLEEPMDLEREITRVFSGIGARKIILFGSRARGLADDSSGVDLIVVYPTDKRFLDRLEQLYALWDLPVAVDILAYTPEEFEQLRQSSDLVQEAVRTGRVIHEAA